MVRNRWLRGVLALIAATTAAMASAQSFRVMDNPLQEEFEYQVPNTLEPAIEVNGIRWLSLKVVPREGKVLQFGEEIPTEVFIELENTTEEKVEVLVIVLLENDKSRQLARLEVGRLKLKPERREEEKTKLKVDGGALRDTRKLWVYLEITQ